MSQGKSSGLDLTRAVEGVGTQADPAHRLDPTGDAGVDGIGADQVGHEVVGLLGRAALAVDRGGGDLVGQALAQPGRAGHVGSLLPGLGHASADDLLDVARIDPGPLDQLDLGVAEQLGGVESGQPAVALADRSADCFDDHWLGHAGSPLEFGSAATGHRATENLVSPSIEPVLLQPANMQVGGSNGDRLQGPAGTGDRRVVGHRSRVGRGVRPAEVRSWGSAPVGRTGSNEVLSRCREYSPESRKWVATFRPCRCRYAGCDGARRARRIDVLVNNAGIPKRRHVTRLDQATVESVMNINYFSPVRLTLALLPQMLERDSGRIINISSVAATLSSPGESSYDASKAAVTAFSESMAIDLWETGIKVLVVYPGLVDTELFTLPDNEPVMASVEMVPVSELVHGVFDALESGAPQVYVPAYFGDIVSAKAADVAKFLSGTASYIASPEGQGLSPLPRPATRSMQEP